jgi:hypothetical protein
MVPKSPRADDPESGFPEEPHAGPTPESGGEDDYPGRAILGSRSERVVLSRLIDGDPLEVEARCRERIIEQALMLALHRVHLRAVARIAHRAPRYRGTPGLDEWMKECIDEALRDLVNEDREEELSGLPPSEPWDPRYAFMSEAIGVEPSLARRACVEFNVLPHEVRRTYFAIGIEGRTIHRYVAEGHGPPSKIQEHLIRALRALGQRAGPTRDDLEGGG